MLIPIIILITLITGIFLFAVTSRNATINFGQTIADPAYTCVLNGNVTLLDSQGNEIYVSDGSTVYAVTYADTPVTEIKISLGWDTTGTEIDWNSFMLTADPVIILDDPFGDPQINPRETVLSRSTSIFPDADVGLEWTLDLQTEIVDVLGTEALQEWGGVSFTFKISLEVSVDDVYGDTHSESTVLETSLIFEWTDPTFTFNPSVDWTTYATIPFDTSNLPAPLVYATVITTLTVALIIVFKKPRRRR